MAENTTPAMCSEVVYEAARAAGLLIVTTGEEAAVQKFADAMYAMGYSDAIDFIATGKSKDSHGQILMTAAPDLLDAAECAARVLFLLEREVSALGLRAGNVRERLSAAIAKAGGDDGRWNERLAEARSDLCDAIQEREAL